MSYNTRYNLRRQLKLPIDKLDFIDRLNMHDEFGFQYNGITYDITWNYEKETKKNILCFSLDIYDGFHAKAYQFYDTIEDFLSNAKIDNELIVNLIDRLIF